MIRSAIVSIVTEGLTGDPAELPGPRAGALAGLALRHVVDALNEGLATLDVAGEVLDASDTFRDLVGGAERLTRLVDEQGRAIPADRRPWAVALAEGPVRDVVVGLDTPGGRRWLRVNASAVSGSPAALVAVADVTAEHEAAAALAAAEQRFRLADPARAHRDGDRGAGRRAARGQRRVLPAARLRPTAS